MSPEGEVKENDPMYRSLECRFCLHCGYSCPVQQEVLFILRLLLSGATRSFEVTLGLVLQEVLGVVILQLLLARKK